MLASSDAITSREIIIEIVIAILIVINIYVY